MSHSHDVPPVQPEDMPTEIAWHHPQQETPTIWMAKPWRPPPEVSTPPSPAQEPPPPTTTSTDPGGVRVACFWLALGLLLGWILY